MQKTPLTLERERFAQVMAARKSARDLIGLTEKLLESDKFSNRFKPYCFADLVTECTTRVGNGTLEELLLALKNAWVGDVIRRVYLDSADQIFCGLVRRALETPSQDETILRRLDILLFANFVQSAEHAIALGQLAGMSDMNVQRMREVFSRRPATVTNATCPF